MYHCVRMADGFGFLLLSRSTEPVIHPLPTLFLLARIIMIIPHVLPRASFDSRCIGTARIHTWIF